MILRVYANEFSEHSIFKTSAQNRTEHLNRQYHPRPGDIMSMLPERVGAGDVNMGLPVVGIGRRVCSRDGCGKDGSSMCGGCKQVRVWCSF